MKPDEINRLLQWAADHEQWVGCFVVWAVFSGLLTPLIIPSDELSSYWWLIPLIVLAPLGLIGMNQSVAWLRSGPERKQAKIEAARERQAQLEAEVL